LFDLGLFFFGFCGGEWRLVLFHPNISQQVEKNTELRKIEYAHREHAALGWGSRGIICQKVL
jgi:zona occludens toxin (predicted ATPase)